MLEWMAGIGGICLVVGGAIFTFGHKQGKTDGKVEKHDKDIENLWDKQHNQGAEISELKEAIPRIDTNIEWIKKALGGSNEA